MINFPNAKINLGLNITEKRSDGYHSIESVFLPIQLHDALEVVTHNGKEEIIFTSSGISIPNDGKENLCVRAYKLIKQNYPLPPIQIHLHKAIPIGAGLGGGSADAAFFIKLINEKFELGLAWGEMHHYAKQLGSDCSFFITNKPAYVVGKGDDFDTINFNLKNYFLVIVQPKIHISTAEAYAGVTPKKSENNLLDQIQKTPINEWKNYIKNDFEFSVFKKHPEIKSIKDKLYTLRAIYASMSGSGSCVYGIFEKELNLQNNFPGLFCKTMKFI